MPDISRLTIRDFALAFGLGGGLLILMLLNNVGGLRDLSLATGHALTAVLVMWALAGVLVSGAMGVVDMVSRDDDDSRPGRRTQRVPVRVRVTRNRRK